MRERVAEAGLPQPIDVTEDVARGQVLDIQETYRIEPTRLHELPCWADRLCDYPVYEGTVRLKALTSESSGELVEFDMTVGDMSIALDLLETYRNLGVFNFEDVTITHDRTYLPFELWGDSADSISMATISVDGISVSDPWCASGWLSIHVEVSLGPRGGRGVSGDCMAPRAAGVGGGRDRRSGRLRD